MRPAPGRPSWGGAPGGHPRLSGGSYEDRRGRRHLFVQTTKSPRPPSLVSLAPPDRLLPPAGALRRPWGHSWDFRPNIWRRLPGGATTTPDPRPGWTVAPPERRGPARDRPPEGTALAPARGEPGPAAGSSGRPSSSSGWSPPAAGVGWECTSRSGCRSPRDLWRPAMDDHFQHRGPDDGASGGRSPFGSAAFLIVCALGGFLLWRVVAGLLGGPC